MCGIAGAFGPGATARGVFSAEMDAMKHRGPDGEWFRFGELPQAKWQIGQNRLAIVDPKGRTHEFSYPYLGIVLAYNGEIYNHGELRHELSDGIPWLSDNDAEVLARAWRRWGVAALDRLNGMFAFCVIDEQRKTAHLVRDRAGEKPLYYTVADDTFYFASEIKGLPRRVLREVPCLDLDVFEYDCQAETPFEGVFALHPGALIEIDTAAGSFAPKIWWAPPFEVNSTMTWEEACARTEALLVSAIRLRAQSAVPRTTYVSGGLDSAIIQQVAKCEHGFSYDALDTTADAIEARHLAVRALGEARRHTIGFTQPMALEALPKIAWHLDTPATWSAIAHWFLAKAAAEDGFKVVLTGEGADELFYGYKRYKALWWLDQTYTDLELAQYRTTIDFLIGDNIEILSRLFNRDGDQSLKGMERLQDLLARYAHKGTLVERAARFEWHTTMQVLLRMADRMTMAHGLENRSPFLDHRLVELAFTMPARHKIGHGVLPQTKRVLREVARRLGVDDRIIDNSEKVGLVVPWNRWFQPSWKPKRGAYDRSHFKLTSHEIWREAWRQRGVAMFS